MSRPFFRARIIDLEAEFDDRRSDVEYLRALLLELDHRSSDRAARLRAQAVEALAAVDKSFGSATPSETSAGLHRPHIDDAPSPGGNSLQPSSSEHRQIPGSVSRGPYIPPPPITNAPDAIIDAWTALEVLSPPTFHRPEDLSGGDRSVIAWLDRERLPWEGDGEKARRNTRLYYQVVLGTVDLETAVTQLLSRYTDTRADRPQARGEAILAVVIVDRTGKLIEAPAAVVSSFGWGMPRALKGDLERLAEWRTAERLLVEQLDEVLRRADKGTFH